MKQPLLHDILAIAMASCMAIGLYRQGERIKMLEDALLLEKKNQGAERPSRNLQDNGMKIKMLTDLSNKQETRINVQEERIKTLEDALLLEKKNQNAERPSRRGLQDNCECPFTKNADGDWVTTDADSLFIFNRGIIIGKKNTAGIIDPTNLSGGRVGACEYGNSILSVDAIGINCPSGEGSVTLGYANNAFGDYSSISGGKYNRVSGFGSSVSGGGANTVSAESESGSISGGLWNTVNGGDSGSISGGYGNTVSGDYGSILGGGGHVIETYGGTVSSKANFKNVTNATVIETIPAHHPEDRIASLEEHSPFDCTAEEGWCTSEHKRFLFSEGVVVGVKNPECKYGTGTLSVDFMGTNCPAHRGSVTFGKKNQMSRAGSFTVG